VTGDNCNGMTPAGSCSGRGSGWTVDAGADVYAQDLYERPTAQTFTNMGGGIKASEYYGYLDITSAKYGYDQSWMYFQTNLFSKNLYKNDGSVDTGTFASGTYYGIQINNQLLLRGEQDKSWLASSPGTFRSDKSQGFCDVNNDVPGPGGVTTPNEKSGNGYESQVVQTDGRLSGGGTALYLRSYMNADGSVSVELAFNYALYNARLSINGNCRPIDPSSVSLVFETTAGMKDNQNYLWNDEYSPGQSGTPYTAAGLKNIYKADNLRADFVARQAPEPASLTLLGVALTVAAVRKRRGLRGWPIGRCGS
jgi:hypothetical protein